MYGISAPILVPAGGTEHNSNAVFTLLRIELNMEWIAGFIIAATVGLTGMGGGSFTVPVLVLIGLPTAEAVGTAMIFAAALRLISSASRMSVKTGPRRKLKLDDAMLKTLVPVMSDGIRSGVN